MQTPTQAFGQASSVEVGAAAAGGAMIYLDSFFFFNFFMGSFRTADTARIPLPG